MITVTASVKSQQFSLYGKVNYLSQDEVKSVQQFDSYGYSLMPLEDSMYIRYHYNITNESKKIYSPKIGFEAGSNMAFQLSRRISLRTGIGLNYLSFKMETQFINTDFVLLGTDTVELTPIIPTFYHPCDTILNSYSDLGPLQNGTEQSLLNLKIPLELDYNLISDKLFLRAGGYLQTPILSLTEREYITTESEMKEGKKICKYVKVTERNTSGNSLNHLQFGVMASVSYVCFKNFGIDLGIAQDLSNTFTKDEYQIYPINGDQYKPLKLSLGIEFKIGNHNGTPISNSLE